MRTIDADILIVPGWSGSGPDHWQRRWAKGLASARLLEQVDWLAPDRETWVGQLVGAVGHGAVGEIRRPVVIVAHSLGVATVAHAGAALVNSRVAGAFLVAPADVDEAQHWPVTEGLDFPSQKSGFAPLPTARLPFPSVLVASSNDPYCRLERARDLARDWGAELTEAGECGHINASSGFGPWPDGLMRLGMFLKGLG